MTRTLYAILPIALVSLAVSTGCDKGSSTEESSEPAAGESTPGSEEADEEAEETGETDEAPEQQVDEEAPSQDDTAEGSAADAPATDGSGAAAATGPETAENPISDQILSREPVTETAAVQHVLISFDEKAQVYAARGGQDPRGAARTRADANALAVQILAEARGDADFAALMQEHSEDPGSARTGRAYDVTPAARLVPPFKALSLRLEPGEVGVVETDFGYHIIKRTQ